MSEHVELVEIEPDIRHIVGVMMLKPDAIEEDLEEYIIDHTLSKLRKDIPDIELAGVIPVESFDDDKVEKIYPDLNENYLRGMKKLLKKPTLVVFWASKSGSADLWNELLKIRGKIGKGHGWEDSIRSAIPIPGRKAQFEQISMRIKQGELSEEDYVELCKGLVHVPDNGKEISGLISSLNQKELEKFLDPKQVSKLLYPR